MNGEVRIWNLVREGRIALVDDLAGMQPAQWDLPSLCSEWRIRDVLAHVTAGAEGRYTLGALTTGLMRHRLSFNRWMAADGIARGARDPKLTLAALRAAAATRKTPPGLPATSVLADLFIHTQDMLRPLGITGSMPHAALLPVADFIVSATGFGTRRRIAGLRLEASDIQWSTGNGPVVSGPGDAIVLVMAGRKAALQDLRGEGKATLTARFP
jgi:uncharacterized protein (TIGR03083 family)